MQGARNVGGTKALLVVRALAKSEAVRRRLAGKAGVPRRDRTLPERLDDFLASAPDPSIASLDKCTGCARCKHDGCRKGKVKGHGARGCTVCSTETGCVEREGECECPYHAREDERWLHKVRERANATDGYTRSFRDAARGYTQQAIDAEYALEDVEDVEFVGVGADGAGGSIRKMKWRHRPDVEQLQDLMETYCGWEPRVTRQKLLDASLAGNGKDGAPQPVSSADLTRTYDALEAGMVLADLNAALKLYDGDNLLLLRGKCLKGMQKCALRFDRADSTCAHCGEIS